jgi:hypothetical protein
MYDLLVWHHNTRNYMYHQANVFPLIRAQQNHISGVTMMISMLSSSAVDRGRVKPKTKTLVFGTSLLSTQH